jgi:hypothetical protein
MSERRRGRWGRDGRLVFSAIIGDYRIASAVDSLIVSRPPASPLA